MTELEIKSITAQNKLMRDILSKESGLHYCITSRAEQLHQIITMGKWESDNKSVTFTKEDYEKMISMSIILKEEKKWSQLNSISESYLDEIRIKKEILCLL